MARQHARGAVLCGKKGLSSPDGVNEWHSPHYLHYSFPVVGKNVQAHLRTHVPQCPHLEVGRSHPVLNRPKRMLHCTFADSHSLRFSVQALFQSIQHCFMFPARYPTLSTCCALRFDGTAPASRTPVAVNNPILLHCLLTPDGTLASWAKIFIIVCNVAKVAFAKQALCLVAGGLWLGQAAPCWPVGIYRARRWLPHAQQ